jgi:uncharacterized protein (DUF488 family)
MDETVIYSIGYEKAAPHDFLATLVAAGIRTLIDVRDLPLSRRAGFSKRQLAAALDAVGIAYVHLKALGTPPEGREANRRRDWDSFWHIVDAKLAGAEAEHALAETAALARRAPSVLLCYEADFHICHRARVGEILTARHGFAVRHLSVRPADA